MQVDGKLVLVTGADGFIGSHLVELLLSKGCKVRALSLYNSFNNWGWLEQIEASDDLEVDSGDVRDPFYCRSLMSGVDIVFHLASLIAIPYSYLAPESYVSTNVNGALNICQAAIDEGVKRVVHTSTSEVYGTAQYTPINEEHPLQAQSPYSASKIAADAMAMSYYNAFDLPLVVARPFNTFGPRQSARAVIPTIIAQIASGQESIKLGDLRPTRDLTLVTDTCRGLVALAECDKAIGHSVNIGSGFEISIGDLATMIRDIMGSDIPIVDDEARLRPAKSEVFRLHADVGRLREWTGFSPEYSLEQGLQKTISWFKEDANLRRYKAGIYNL